MPQRVMPIADYVTQREAEQLEKDLQAAIVEALNLSGYWVFEFAKPGGHKALRGATPVGWPDLLVGGAGRCCGIEIKRPGKEMTPDQRVCAHTLGFYFGIKVYTVHSVDEAIEVARHMLSD